MVWAADSTTADGGFVALFNTGTGAAAHIMPLADLGLQSSRMPATWRLREAWSGQEAGAAAVDGMPALAVDLPPHGVQFFRCFRG